MTSSSRGGRCTTSTLTVADIRLPCALIANGPLQSFCYRHLRKGRCAAYKLFRVHDDKLDIQIMYAGLEERRGEFNRATEILRELEQKHHPEVLDHMLRRINLQRRRNNVDAVHEHYSARVAK